MADKISYFIKMLFFLHVSLIQEYEELNARCVRRLFDTANVVPSSPIFVTLMMEALRSSETLVL
jgi:hypothetical protein